LFYNENINIQLSCSQKGVFDVTLCDKVCQWPVAGRWFLPGISVSSTNKAAHHDITKILLKGTLSTITLTPNSNPNCDYECTWWRLVQTHNVCTELDIYVLISVHNTFLYVTTFIMYAKKSNDYKAKKVLNSDWYPPYLSLKHVLIR